MVDPLVSRRLFLADLGRGALAVAVLGVAACTPSAGSSGAPSAAFPPASGSGAPPVSPGGASAAAGSPATSAAPAGSGAEPSGGGPPAATAWTRVNLGFVSAYLLVRGGEAAVVDTGVAGSEDEIGAALAGIGLEWAAVAHVILTHKHPDHAGSITAVMNAAPAATGWIGAGDLSAVQATRALRPLNDGDRVFGLRIVGTPGHTVGHISVLDEAAGVLAAGDALRTNGGPLAGSNPQFTEDPTAARATVLKLGALTFETLLPGHGEPILTGAAAQVKALAGA